MKATEFPFEELNKATHMSEAFAFYQYIGDKNWIYWKIPHMTRYDLEQISKIIKYAYFSISAEKQFIIISFLIIDP